MSTFGSDASYHYPPELFQLLVDTIPRLCRSKRDVFLFLRGAGVPENMVTELRAELANDRDSVSKFHIVRTVLGHLNEAGDTMLRQRRELVKRVVQFEDFSTCWPSDRLEAQGLVAEVRRVVNVKDSFTRIQQERDAEVRQRREAERNEMEALRERRSSLEGIKQDFNRLFAMVNPQERGSTLEGVLNRLFAASGILVREAFTRSSESGRVIEQIDGVIELDGDLYLVEMKWHQEPIGVPEVSQHLFRVFNRSEKRGIYISYSGYTAPAISICREQLNNAVIVLCTLQEFVLLLEREDDLREFLKAKVRGSILDKEPFTQVLS